MKPELHSFAKRVFGIAGALPLRLSVRIKRGILVRFTNNGVYQNGFQDLFFYTLSFSTKTGPVFVESNDISDSGIWEAVQKLKMAVPDPLPLKPVFKGRYPAVCEYFPFGLAKTPELAARAIERGIERISEEQASANGYFSVYERFFYLADSRGLELFHPATAVRYGITVTKGAGKGYFSFYHPNFKKLDVDSIVREALDLARKASQREVTLKPGTYECVISPRAFLEFAEPIRRHFDLNLYESGKSIFSGNLGKRLFSKHLTLHEDITHSGQYGVPFDAEGKPKRKVALIERGVLKNLISEGDNTHGLRENPFDFENLTIARGSLPLSEILSRIRRGIFVNKIRYHALVRETGLEVTGLTTAGSVYIEKGQVMGQLTHLRYHDSIITLLKEIAGVSRETILLKDGERGVALLPYFWFKKFHVV